MKENWWQQAVIYQIYPRSFMDANQDGMGDLQGIISKLDYLADLGIEVIWLSPVYKSPMDDNGYDISDYQDIAPEFGTLADMDALIAEAGKRNIKIMMDLVVNHTSDEHPWFQEALSDPTSPYRDFYIFRQPKGPIASADDVRLAQPSSMGSIFGGSAWEYLSDQGQYYFHMFSKKQPDLNWENPEVEAAVYDMMNWWLDRGVAGFRMDVIDLIGKEIDKGITGNGPRLHGLLQTMHQKTLAGRNAITVGETWGATPEIAKLYSDPKRQELSMVFQFEHVSAFSDPEFGKWRPVPVDFQVIKQILAKWQTELSEDGWNSLFWNNHDLPRAVSKYGDTSTEESRVASAKMLATLLHGMKGSPYIYQGEELGMTNVAFESIEDYQDIEIHNSYKGLVLADPEYADPEGKRLSHESMMAGIYENGRDNARTPMHWDASPNAGFTTAVPWLKVNPNYPLINAEAQVKDPESVFSHYKRLIALRKQLPVMVMGSFEWLSPDEPDHMIYLRRHEDQTMLVLVNHSGHETNLRLPLALRGTDWQLLSSVSCALPEEGTSLSLEDDIMLAPYEAFIALKKSTS